MTTDTSVEIYNKSLEESEEPPVYYQYKNEYTNRNSKGVVHGKAGKSELLYLLKELRIYYAKQLKTTENRIKALEEARV